MSETKKCKYCKSEIDKKARVCPNCRKKQGGILKFIIIALIAISVIGAVLGNNEPDRESNSNSVNNQQEANGNKDGKEKDTKIALGAEGQSEDLILKVNQVGEANQISENKFISYKPDSGKYAIINVTIKNTGKEAISLTNGYFKLISTEDAEYTPTILVGLDNKYISFESINPGLDITGNLVYEVPTDFVVSDSILRFYGTGLFTGASDFALK